MRWVRSVWLLGLCAGTACETRRRDESATPPSPLAGTWRLVDFWDHDASSPAKTYPLGDRPCGYLVYAATGHMSVQITAGPRVARPDSSARVTEGIPGVYASYFGRYTVDTQRGVVVHHIEGNLGPAPIQDDDERPFQLRGDTLVLGNGTTWARTFVRARANERNAACLQPGR